MPLFLRGAVGTAVTEADSRPVLPALSRAPLSLQRAPLYGASAPAPTDAHVGQAPEEAAPDPALRDDRTPVPGLIVEDDAAVVGPGQMRKSDFLARLRQSVCAAAEEGLAGTLWSTVGCPYIERWLAHYAEQSAEQVERALRRYVPEAAGAATAAGYVPLVTARVRAAIAQWATTGEAEEGTAAGAAPPAAGGGGIFSSLARLFFKGEDGGARQPASPAAVRASLGRGQPLDGGLASRMGAAFRRDFSGVRVHTDGGAAATAGRLNARAFTVAEHVAFGRGEYRPGTPIGDALIAHELAHVLQQEGSAASLAPAAPGVAPDDSALEEEADRSAVAAVAASRGIAPGWLGMFLPRLRSGLRLSRCATEEKAVPTGIHYDLAVSKCTSSRPLIPEGGVTRDESVTAGDIKTHLKTINAGGTYVFFGHGKHTMDLQWLGIEPQSGKTVKGEDIKESLSADENPPTLVVLGACGSAASLGDVTAGGVPVAVGFGGLIDNFAAAGAVTSFMGKIQAGSTFEAAREHAQAEADRSQVEVVVEYSKGYHGGMTLQDARKKHWAEVGR